MLKVWALFIIDPSIAPISWQSFTKPLRSPLPTYSVSRPRTSSPLLNNKETTTSPLNPLFLNLYTTLKAINQSVRGIKLILFRMVCNNSL